MGSADLSMSGSMSLVDLLAGPSSSATGGGGVPSSSASTAAFGGQSKENDMAILDGISLDDLMIDASDPLVSGNETNQKKK